MPPSRELYVDFDGTLVNENSGLLLRRMLLAAARTPYQRFVRCALTSMPGWPLRKLVNVLSRLNHETDYQTWLVLSAFHSELADPSLHYFDQIADQLTLNHRVSSLIGSRPFIILSTGLEPVITRFLQRYPKLACRRVVASTATTTNEQMRFRLTGIAHKTRLLRACQYWEYYSDFAHEVQAIQAGLPAAAELLDISRPHVPLFHLTYPTRP